MKRIVIVFISLFILASGTSEVLAQQNYKLGHINTQELLSMMPETDSARKALEKESQSIQRQLEEMQVELNRKYNDYMQKADSLSDFIRQSKEEELQSLQQRIQSFEGNAQQSLQQKRSQLFEPIIQKANNAIERVAKENGYSYIFDTSAGAVVFQAENTENIMPLVKEELGLE